MKTHLQVYQLYEKPIYNNNISYTETPSVNISVKRKPIYNYISYMKNPSIIIISVIRPS